MTGDGQVVLEAFLHRELGAPTLGRLRQLFDAEYLESFGAWDPEQPYGYAPHDLHVIARMGSAVVGHVGWARRTVGVGEVDVVIAGVGGVLISPDMRGSSLGRRLMHCAAETMADVGGIDFGYLGCREEVVPFYESCGWHRISVPERSIGLDGAPVADPPGQPLLILPIGRKLAEWPAGGVDLRGRAW